MISILKIVNINYLSLFNKVRSDSRSDYTYDTLSLSNLNCSIESKSKFVVSFLPIITTFTNLEIFTFFFFFFGQAYLIRSYFIVFHKSMQTEFFEEVSFCFADCTILERKKSQSNCLARKHVCYNASRLYNNQIFEHFILLE